MISASIDYPTDHLPVRSTILARVSPYVSTELEDYFKILLDLKKPLPVTCDPITVGIKITPTDESTGSGITSASKIIPENDLKLHSLLECINSFKFWKENWNGYEVSAPKIIAIYKAQKWVVEIYNFANKYKSWIEPSISPDEAGDIVFDWKYADRMLSVTVTDDGEIYLQKDELSNDGYIGGDITDQKQMENLWQWLTK